MDDSKHWRYSIISAEQVPVLWRKKRWAVSFFISLCIVMSLVILRQEPSNVREYMSALAGNYDYTPYITIDGFKHFAQSEKCHLSSLEVYQPTKALCQNRQQLMDAMSDGGRIGFDAPYQSRECDMRWYSTAEICTILSRFDTIHLVGDSMMRHLSHGLMTFLREDLVDGPRSTWREQDPGQLDCSCRVPYENANCWRDGLVVTDTESVWQHDADSMKCIKGKIADIDFQWSAKAPAPVEELNHFKKSVHQTGRQALVFGHGTWDDYDTEAAQKWLRAFEAALAEATPDYQRSSTGDKPPLLFITPNAQGLNKEKAYIASQNNIRLMRFEREVREWLGERGWDTLGMFNLTVQSVSLDGTHATMESNLVKSMMVLNWLDWVGRS